MIEIRKITFNDFQVNTYFIFDETKDTLIVDPACYGDAEEKICMDFIEENNLNPVKIVNTHAHIDHIIGNALIKNKYEAKLMGHPAGVEFYNNAASMAVAFGFNMEEAVFPDIYIDEGDTVDFGTSFVDVIYTPGHADGSISLLARENKTILVGDVLFLGSIGRTDLPTGNHEILLQSIKDKILSLGGEYQVLPGHGPETTVQQEKNSNPFLI